MKNISKLFVGILFSALVMAPSYAGEMTVTGGATATYTTNGDDASAGKNLAVSNELDFTASGELDNGYTWKYQVQLDGTSTANDDTRLEIGTDQGTVGIYVSEGGMSAELHGVGAMGPGFDYISPSSFSTGYDVDGYANIQYHLPSGILPLGGSLKLGYVPNMSNTTMVSAKESDSTITSEATGRKLEMVSVGLAPIDGLSIKGSAARTSDETGTSGPNGKEEGVWTTFDEQGQKTEETTFKEGKEDGLYSLWYENGLKKAEGPNKGKCRIGLWTWYYKSGIKEKEINYSENGCATRDGTSIRYDINGKKLEEILYIDGSFESRKKY